MIRRPTTRPIIRRKCARLALHAALAAGVLVASGPARAQQPPGAAPGAPAAGGRAAAEAAEPAPAPAETAWVRAELRVNYRSSPSTGATPLGIVSTGDQVVVLERRGGWARVRVENGESGWLPESVLTDEAPPIERVAQLEAELAAVREELARAQREIETLQRRDEEREARAAEREAALEQLEKENRDLRAGERWPYLVTGAALLGAGLTAGLLLRGGGSRRYGGRIRF